MEVLLRQVLNKIRTDYGNPAPRTYLDDCAKAAIEYADALIAELRKEKD